MAMDNVSSVWSSAGSEAAASGPQSPCTTGAMVVDGAHPQLPVLGVVLAQQQQQPSQAEQSLAEAHVPSTNTPVDERGAAQRDSQPALSDAQRDDAQPQPEASSSAHATTSCSPSEPETPTVHAQQDSQLVEPEPVPDPVLESAHETLLAAPVPPIHVQPLDNNVAVAPVLDAGEASMMVISADGCGTDLSSRLHEQSEEAQVLAFDVEHEDRLWTELLSSAAFSEWKQELDKAVIRSPSKTTSMDEHPMLLPMIVDDGEVMVAVNHEKAGEVLADDAATTTTTTTTATGTKRKRKGEPWLKARKTFGGGKRMIKQVEDSNDEEASDEEAKEKESEAENREAKESEGEEGEAKERKKKRRKTKTKTKTKKGKGKEKGKKGKKGKGKEEEDEEGEATEERMTQPSSVDEDDPYALPMQHGWKREVVNRQSGATARVRSDVYYFAPDGKKLRSSVEVGRYLAEKSITDLDVSNFSYNPRREIRQSEKRLASKAFAYAFGYSKRVAGEDKKTKARRAKAASARKARKYTRRAIAPVRRSKPRKAATGKKVMLHRDDISGGKEPIPIECVSVRSSAPPETFEYIRKSIVHPSITVPSVPYVCCTCTDRCTDPAKCECIQSTLKFAEDTTLHTTYDQHGLMPHDYPIIIECGQSCQCAAKDCNNNVTQGPIKFRLQLFETKNRGWGVRTMEDIPSGSFVMEYVGEIISNELAEVVVSDTYLLDLDVLETMEQWHLQKKAAEEAAQVEVKIEKASAESSGHTKRKRRKRGAVWSSKIKRKRASTTSSSLGASSQSLGDDEEQVIDEGVVTTMSQPLLVTLELPDEEDEEDWVSSQAPSEANVQPQTLAAQQSRTAIGDAPAVDGKAVESVPVTEAGDEWRVERRIVIDLNAIEDENDKNGERAESHDATSADAIHKLQRVTIGNEAENEIASVKSENGDEEDDDDDESRNGIRMRLYGERDPYVVNPHMQGNIARFLNHSCNPNLWIVPVVSGLQDLRFATPCFFAAYDILAGTELTWNYARSPGINGPRQCRCGEPNCRGFL